MSMSMSKLFSRKVIEYGIYILILILCIAGIYWRFWYHPKVEPVIMIDPTGFPKGQAIPRPLLDPNFSWRLVRIDPEPPMAIFKNDGSGKCLILEVNDEIEDWKITSIERTVVVVTNANGDRRALFYSRKQP